MEHVRRYWWVVPAVLAGAYWTWRAWYVGDDVTLAVILVVLVVAAVVAYVVRRQRRVRRGRR